jgi:hypothetical protein
VTRLVTCEEKQQSDTKFGWEISWKNSTYEVFTAVKIQVEVFWVLTPRTVVVRHQRFRSPCCIHFHGESGYRYLVWNTERPH